MRAQVLQKLMLFGFELHGLSRQNQIRRSLSARNFPLFNKYVDHVYDWLSRWREDFNREIADRKEKSFKEISDRKSLELKVYFALRYQFLPFLIVDFTQSPFMLSHQVFMSAVKTIIQEEESVCEIMMPWVQRIIGYADEAKIKEATEEADGQFKLNRFVSVKNDRYALISIVDYLDYVRVSTDIAARFFDSSYPALLEVKLGVQSKNYIRAIEYLFRKSTSDPSCFAYHVHQLAMSLHERSVSRGGSEMAADHRYEHIVSEFFDVWKALPNPIRNTLSALRVDSSDKSTFKDCLLVIFASSPNVKIQLSSDDLSRERKRNMINCANILSTTLLSFLQKNRAEWSELKVIAREAAHASGVRYTEQDLNVFRGSFIKAIDNSSVRSPSDSFFISAFNEDNKKNYDDFFSIVNLIPLMNDEGLQFLYASCQLMFAQRRLSLFSNAQDIFDWLSNLNDKELCGSIWFVCRERWGVFFTKTNDIMVLTDFLSDRFVDLALSYYKDKILSEYTPDVFLYPNNPRLAYEFMFRIVKRYPEIIVDFSFLLECILMCQSKKELDNFFSLVHPRILFLFLGGVNFNGGRWVVFLGVITERLRLKSFSRVQNELVYVACIENILPCFIGRGNVLEHCWDNAYVKRGCLSCLFSAPRVHDQDRSLYRRLDEIYKKDIGGSSMSLQNIADVVFSLSDFLSKNEGGLFLKKLRESFHVDFFAKTIGILRCVGMISHPAPRLEQMMTEVL